MSILFMDNFQFYGLDASQMLAGMPWSNIYSVNSLSDIVDDPDPNADADSKAFKFAMSSTGASVDRLAIPTPGKQMGVGCRLWVSGLPSTYAHGAGIQFNTAGNLPMYLVCMTPTGTLRLIRRDKSGWTSSGDTVIDETTTPVITAGAWWHIEFYMDTDTGDYEVRVEGVTVLDGNDAGYHTDEMAIFVLVEFWDCTAADTKVRYCKDLIIWDNNGTVNNSFVGPVTIYTLKPDGDVSSGWSRSSGDTDWELVDELTPDDAGYIQADDTLPAAAIMTLTDLPADVVSVRALQTVVRAAKTDGGDAFLQNSLISGASTDDGADNPVLTSFSYHFDVSELDPATAAAWTPAAVNAAEIKLNRTL